MAGSAHALGNQLLRGLLCRFVTVVAAPQGRSPRGTSSGRGGRCCRRVVRRPFVHRRGPSKGRRSFREELRTQVLVILIHLLYLFTKVIPFVYQLVHV